MTHEQDQAYEKHRKEQEKVLVVITALPISEEWTTRFSKQVDIPCYRNDQRCTALDRLRAKGDIEAKKAISQIMFSIDEIAQLLSEA